MLSGRNEFLHAGDQPYVKAIGQEEHCFFLQ